MMPLSPDGGNPNDFGKIPKSIWRRYGRVRKRKLVSVAGEEIDRRRIARLLDEVFPEAAFQGSSGTLTWTWRSGGTASLGYFVTWNENDPMISF